MSSTSGDVIRQAAIYTRLELWLKGYAVWQEAGTSPASPDFLLIFSLRSRLPCGRMAEEDGKGRTAKEDREGGRGMNLVQLLDAHTQWDELAVICLLYTSDPAGHPGYHAACFAQ